MKVDVIMPKMGESINEGTIIKWHKQKGDKVEKDEIIFEISTDKVDTEIPSPASGVLIDVKVFEQETVEVDTVVAVIEANGEVSADAEQVEENMDEIRTTSKVGGEIIDIPMPKMGESIMEGTIIRWLKQKGDKVEKDEIIFEISTDKVDTEVPSPVAGTIVEILYKENETVEVDTVVAKISSSGGKPIPIDKTAEVKKESKNKTEKIVIEKRGKLDTSASNRFYSPLVMSIANKENVTFDELEKISGSGVNNRVTKRNILKYVDDRKHGRLSLFEEDSKNEVKQEAAKVETIRSDDEVEVIAMDNIRQRIMYHMVNSKETSVHVTAVIEVDMTAIHNYIQMNKDNFLRTEKVKLTYMPFISHAVIKSLKEFPLVNASIDGNNIVMKKYINIGIAVAVEPNGLIVPNIKNADTKSLRGLAKEIIGLSEKAHSRGLKPDDIMKGTFSITNYGVFGSLFGTPIINQPEVAILGVGAVTKKPVVVESNGVESIAIKPMMYLSLSHDHRLVDGLLGGKFLKSIKDRLENFDVNSV